MAVKRVVAVTSNGPVNSVGKLEWDPNITNPLLIEMVDLLRCHQCKKLNYYVNNLSKCDHILCNECKNTMSFRKCPICKLPAMEIKKDVGYESLIKDIRTLNQQWLKIHFTSDKNSAPKSAAIDKRVLSPPRPLNLNPFPSPTKKKDDIVVEIDASQNSTQLSEATSIFTQEKVDDKDSDGETVGFVNKRKGRIGKVVEKAVSSKKQKITSDANDSGDTDGGILDKNKKADKERVVDKEKEKVSKDKEEKEKAKEKEAQKKLEKEKKEAEKLEKEKAKKLEKERKEEEKEAARERQRERIRERERAKERAAEKAKEKAKIKESAETKDQDKEIEGEKDRDKTNEKDAEKEDDKTRPNRKRRVPAKIMSKETENEEKAQKDDSKAKQVESATKRRGKQMEEEQKSDSRETKATSRVNKKITEEKEKEQKTEELKLEEKRVTRSTPTKSEPTNETGDLTASHRRAGRAAKNLENVSDKIEDKQDNNNEEDNSKTKTKGSRKSVTFSPAKEVETLVSPRKSPRSNKGNMMYNRRPDEVSTFPVRGRPDVNKSKEKETESEQETPKSANNKATYKGRAKQKVTKEAEASAEEDDDVFVKPKAKGKRGARQDSTDPSPLKRQRRGKDTSDESDVSSSLVQTPSIKSTASTTGSRTNSRILVASTLLTEDQKTILEKFKNTLGIKVTADFPNSVSHLVTKSDANKRAVRSLKYMKALLSNKWILSFDWIIGCLKAGEIISEEPFELVGTTKQSEDTLGVTKISRTSKKKLFSGISFHFDGKFKGPDLPSLDELKEIILSGSGTILDNNSRLNSALRKNEKVVIVKDRIKEDDKSYGNGKIIDTSHLLSIVTTFNTDDLFN